VTGYTTRTEWRSKNADSDQSGPMVVTAITAKGSNVLVPGTMWRLEKEKNEKRVSPVVLLGPLDRLTKRGAVGWVGAFVSREREDNSPTNANEEWGGLGRSWGIAIFRGEALQKLKGKRRANTVNGRGTRSHGGGPKKETWKA